MQLSNVRDFILKPSRDGSYAYEATVDVTTVTGLWWFKKTTVQTRKVFKRHGYPCWRFLDTGEYTPGCQMEELAEVEMYKKGWK